MKGLALLFVPFLANIATGFDWVQQDCYGDKTWDRRLKRYYRSTGFNPSNPAESNLKPAFDSCKAGAEEKNYDYFGIQNTHECWGEIGQPEFKKFGKVSRCATGKDGYKIGLKDANAVYAIKVDGGFTKWSEWSHCRHTCGDSTQKRFRTCTNPKPRGVGKDCEGPREESRKCSLPPCNVDGGFSAWTDWTPCGKTCGDAIRSRSRSCTNPIPVGNGKKCTGPTKETKSCGLPVCLVNGWVPLDCYKDQVSSRRLRNYYKSTGISWPANPSAANLKPMYDSCKAGAEERGYDYFGIQYRSECWGDMDGKRYDDFGKSTSFATGKDGYKVGFRSTNCVYAIQVDGAWTKWTEWSPCLKTCGAAVRIRSRACTNPKPRGLGKKCPGHASESKACDNPPCIDDKWVPLDCFKDKVSDRRLRKYYKSTGVTWPAEPTKADLKPMFDSCKAGAEANKFDYFGIQYFSECWGDDIGAEYKKFGKAEPKDYAKGRDGYKVGFRSTNCVYVVKVDCGFTKWSEWSQCTKTCGEASKSRTREATNPPQRGIGKKCEGPLRETKSCNLKPCVDEKWKNLGCWKDVVGARALPHYYQSTGVPYPNPDNKANLKPVYDACKKGAEKKDFCYFGLQYRTECWGGDEGAPYKKYGPVKTFGTGKDGYSVGYANTNCVWGKKIDGGWSEWSTYTPCDKTCGEGVRKRTRSCTNPKRVCLGDDCPGPATETKACVLPSCDDDKYLPLDCFNDKVWSRRLPHFMGVTEIPYPANDALANLKPIYDKCKAMAKANGYPWFGIQYRHECWGGPQTADYSAFGPTETYGVGKDGYKVGYEDTNCVYAKNIDGGWSPWGQWSDCGKTCGQAFRTRKRTHGCTNPVPQGTGKPCEGPSEEKKSCNLPLCPGDGGWGNFTKWSECTKDCGGGIQYKTRCCDSPVRESTGAKCHGQDVKTRACNNKKCPDVCTNDEYKKKPCLNGGTCVATGKKTFKCRCPKHCTGSRCENCAVCKSQGYEDDPCQNGGTCVPDKNGKYTCKCPKHCTGNRCQNCDVCKSDKYKKDACQNGGTCVPGKNGEYTCKCPKHCTGNRCQNCNVCKSDKYNKDACQNGGTCVPGKNGEYTCKCPKHCTGNRCQNCNICITDKYKKDPCQNGGTCVDGKNGDYTCKCPTHCTGNRCQNCGVCKNDKYKKDPCQNGGTCVPGKNGKYTCKCPKHCTGNRCQNCDVCKTDKYKKDACQNGGTCVPGKNGEYTCKCPKHCTGNRCQNCDVCKTDKYKKDACQNGGTCVPGKNGEYTCKCPEHCTGNRCQNCDVCKSNKYKNDACQNGGTCVADKNGKYTCKCPKHCKGNRCQNCDACESDKYKNDPCQNGGTCKSDGKGGYTCECTEHCKGSRCEKCDNTDGGYTPWGEWTPCPVTCGYGTQTRKRTCTNPPPSGGGKDCSGLGPATMTKECATNLCESPCKDPKIFDLAVVVDASKSIGKENFKKVREFLATLVAQYTVSPEKTRIGIMAYSTSPRIEWYLKPLAGAKYQNVGFLQRAVRAENGLRYLAENTRTDKALSVAGSQFFNSKTDRPQYPNVMIVLTDGKTNAGSRPYSEVLKPLKAKNIRVMAVGVGSEIDDSELTEIAMGVKKHVLHLSDFDQLTRNMDELLNEACKTK